MTLFGKSQIRFFLVLNLGLVITAVGIAVFEAPNNFAMGGASGAAIVLTSFFPRISVGGFLWILNLALLALGFVFLGRVCAGWTAYSSLALSFYVSVLQHLFPMAHPLTNDMLIEVIFSVMLPAVGMAMVFNVGASTGGTDILAMILAKYTGFNIGWALFASDILIVMAAMFRFDVRTGLYCIIGILIRTFIVDGFIESVNIRKVCTIITDNPKPILNYILHTLNRSATVTKAEGGQTREPKEVIMSCLTRSEATRLRRFARKLDPHSFMTIVSSSEIIGNGFKSL